MNTIATFIVALILLSAAGLVFWVWFAMAHVEEELRFAVFGGLAGEGVAEAINPPRARADGGDDISGRDYEEKGSSLDKCGPAYVFGVDARGRYPGRGFDDVESEMSSDWAASRGASILNWGWAKHGAREAWVRMSRSNSLCA